METGLFDGMIALSGQMCELDGARVFANPISREDLSAAVAGAEAGEFTLGFVGGYENFMNRVDEYVLRADAFGGMPPIRLRPARDALALPVYQLHLYGCLLYTSSFHCRAYFSRRFDAVRAFANPPHPLYDSL